MPICFRSRPTIFTSRTPLEIKLGVNKDYLNIIPFADASPKGAREKVRRRSPSHTQARRRTALFPGAVKLIPDAALEAGAVLAAVFIWTVLLAVIVRDL